MSPGPLPSTQRRRRNAPTLPTTRLPVSGRKGTVPKPPDGYEFGDRGKAFWAWAWGTPQAAAWDAGVHVALARRAMLEDDLAALKYKPTFGPLPTDDEGNIDLEQLDKYVKAIEYVVGRLQGLAANHLRVMKEMRELDNALGLTPKALAGLRWEVVPDGPEPFSGDEVLGDDEVGARRRAREARLSARNKDH